MKKAYFRGLSALFLIATMVSQFVFSVSSVAAFAGGDGSEGSPYQIATCEEFKDIDDDLDAYYVLSNDLDCTSDGNSITVAVSNPFSGTFDGGEHSIAIAINDPETSSPGLFDRLSGTVSDLTLTGTINTDASEAGALASEAWDATISNITSSVTISQDGEADTAGGVVGQFGGFGASATGVSSSGDVTSLGGSVGGLFGSSECGPTITDSFSTGDVTGAEVVGGLSGFDGCEGPGASFTNVYSTGDIDGGDMVGGIVGFGWSGDIELAYSTGSITSGGSAGGIYGETPGYEDFDIIKSYATGQVEGGNYVGGIIGLHESSGTIDQSFSTAGIQTNGNYAGGIAGSISGGGSITNSYAREALHGDYNGGIVGDASEGTIINSYSTALLDLGSAGWGGIAPSVAEGASATNTFWDVEAANSGDSALGTGKSTAQMKSIATFTTELGEGAWNFDGIWSIGESNDGYPCLQWSDVSCDVEEVSSDDGDGISSAVENAGPNNGDANNDGIADAAQANVASYVNPISGAYSVLAVDAACSITSIQSVAESALGSTQDANYSYPAGLMNFTIDCGEVGFVATITQYHYGIEGNFIVRKNTPSLGYFALDQASDTKQTIGGQAAAVAAYQVIDGGTLDIDGQANGVIIDPAGLAESTTLADTGANTATIQLLAAALVLVGGTMFVAQHRAYKRG